MTDREQSLDKGTEERILTTARDVFLRRGKNGARMEEIAKEAGVNKALLHYYYRSKDNIFRAVFRQVGSEILRSIVRKLDFEQPMESLLRSFVTGHIAVIRKNRALLQFFFSELWMNRDEVLPLFCQILTGEERPVYDLFFDRVNRAVREGEIRPVEPFHLLMNVISLDVFYFVAAPLFFSMADIPEAKQKELDSARADEVADFIWAALRPVKEKNS